MPAKVQSPQEAVAQIPDGASIFVSGFGEAGMPHTLVAALNRHSTAKNLTIITNNCGPRGRGLGRLVLSGRVARVVGSFFTPNPDIARLHEEGQLAVTLRPQGTFIEAIRAAGAGIPAFFTPTGVGTEATEGKEVRRFGDRDYVLEEALPADFAFVRARQADEYGNLVYRKTGRNFGPMMATAARLTIAEVDDVVPIGALDPEAIVTPHLYVNILVRAEEKDPV